MIVAGPHMPLLLPSSPKQNLYGWRYGWRSTKRSTSWRRRPTRCWKRRSALRSSAYLYQTDLPGRRRAEAVILQARQAIAESASAAPTSASVKMTGRCKKAPRRDDRRRGRQHDREIAIDGSEKENGPRFRRPVSNRQGSKLGNEPPFALRP
jgi:hypothetical protein